MYQLVKKFSRFPLWLPSRTFSSGDKNWFLYLNQPEKLNQKPVLHLNEAKQGLARGWAVHGVEFGFNNISFISTENLKLIQAIKRTHQRKQLLNQFQQRIFHMPPEEKFDLVNVQVSLFGIIQEHVILHKFEAQIEDKQGRTQTYWKMNDEQVLTLCLGTPRHHFLSNENQVEDKRERQQSYWKMNDEYILTLCLGTPEETNGQILTPVITM